MQGLCQGRNVTRSPGLTSTIKTIHLLSLYFRSFPKSMFRTDNLQKPPWRNIAIGNFLSVVGRRDGEGKASWKVANLGDLGVLSTLRTHVTVPRGQERNVGWRAVGGQRIWLQEDIQGASGLTKRSWGDLQRSENGDGKQRQGG